MVRAILDGRKTVTRRIVKPCHMVMDHGEDAAGQCINAGYIPCLPLCPYGLRGDRLWVRETWAQPTTLDPGPTFYRADYPECVPPQYQNVPPASEIRWKPSIHMPRPESRITLEIIGVRVERLHAISEADAMAEGITTTWPDGPRMDDGPNHYTITIDQVSYNAPTAVEAFRMLWSAINGPESWDANPWVWVLSFKRVTP